MNDQVRQRRRQALAAAVGAALLHGAIPAGAAPASQADRAATIDEMVVTASKRDTNLQDTALSVSALSGEAMRDAGLYSIGNAATFVAGVSLLSDEPGSNEIIMRGVTASTSTATSTDVIVNSTTSVYLDQLPVTSTVQKTPDFRFVDMARVEVLKGPQGTIYGQSAMGGVVRYITNKPETTGVEGGVGSYYSGTEDGGDNLGLDGYLNVPLSDSLAVRFVGYRYENDGFIDVVGTSTADDANDESTVGGRAALRWLINERMSFDFTYLYHEVDVRTHQLISSTYRPTGNLADRGRPVNLRFVDTSRLEVQHENPSFEDAQVYNAEFLAELDGFDVNLVLGRKQTDSDSVFEAAEIVGSTENYSNNRTLSDVSSDTAELRLVSNDEDARFSWIVGLWYEDAGGTIGVLNTATGIAVPALGIRLGDHTLDSGRQLEFEEKALYGEVRFDVTDALAVTAGYRRAKVDNNYRWTYARGTFDGLLGRVALLGIDQQTSEDVNLYKLNVEYRISDSLLVYGQAASGYRPGGFNPGNAMSVPVVPDSDFASDDLWNYELGVRSSWLEDRLIVNAFAYFIDWQDIQLQAVQLRLPFYASVQNAGEAEVKGFEVETEFKATDNLSLAFNYAYTNAELTDAKPSIPGTSPFPGRSGDALPGTAESQVSASVDWRGPLFDGVELLASATYRYVGERPSAIGSAIEMDAYSLVDLRVGVSMDNGLGVSLFADNVTNEIAVNRISVAALPNFQYYAINRPRTIGLRASYAF